MSIEDIELAEPNRHLQPSREAEPVAHTDSVDISAESKTRGQAVELATTVALSSPDLRPALVSEMRSKMKHSSYISGEVMGVVADKIIDSFGV